MITLKSIDGFIPTGPMPDQRGVSALSFLLPKALARDGRPFRLTCPGPTLLLAEKNVFLPARAGSASAVANRRKHHADL